ncbi:hypothetical protein ASPZODRAFT_145071 [Penicilliopsis zonata CBS 506.65]|uniref:Protein kinase domain-containing protein n=1 Tax=Penicilliopsis zonata CBS 506.65 TaxID=1073090 RepID=A0A1L9S9U3_9EURO|nr:hypothetical protein ASPZODRAFT_145071 [Penicilliopsis zonata CBS 506.65]OJJ43934.1 hypothetical protein ASPZODRAFT_145071 [Penicilliopsis zonata CBS 506.65]
MSASPPDMPLIRQTNALPFFVHLLIIYNENIQLPFTPRKVPKEHTKFVDGRVIYKSQSFGREKGHIKYGLPVLSDFGEARIGNVHTGLIQPDLYRAPGVVLGMEWTSKVDIWNVGTLIWDLFEDHHLFDGRGPDNLHSDEHLLAEMVAILGPPPVTFLQKCPASQWKGEACLPDITLEDSEEYLEGQNKIMFLRFMRKMLQWDPDKRHNARELLEDPWLKNF